MDTSEVVDGGVLRGGMYRYTGSFQYLSTGGAHRTVAAFEKLSEDEIKEQERNARLQAERDAKEEEERAKREQPKRKLFAKEILTPFDFNIESRFRASRELALRTSVSVRHFAWKKMVELREKEDWLGLLNVFADVADQESDFTNRYKLYPDEQEMMRITGKLLEEDGPLHVSIDVDPPTGFVLLRRNPLWEHIPTNRHQKVRYIGEPFEVVNNGNGRDGNAIPFGQTYYIGRWNEVAVLAEDDLSEAESAATKAQNKDLVEIMQARRKCARLYNEFQRREIPASEYFASLKETVDSVPWNDVLGKLFFPLGDKEQIEKLNENDVQINSETFGPKILALHLGLGDRLIVQDDLRQYIHSIKVPDLLWNELRKLQKEKDWKGMFTTVAKYTSKPQNVDFSNKKQLDDLLKELLAKEFRLEVRFTYAANFSAMSVLRSIESGRMVRIDKIRDISSSHGGILSHEFRVGDTVILYSRSSCDDEVTKLWEDSLCALREDFLRQYQNVDRAISDRRISAEDGDARKKMIVEKYGAALVKWLHTKKVKIADPQIGVVRPVKWKDERDLALLTGKTGSSASTVQKDCEMFRSCWDGITPNSKAKTKLQKQSSVLIQAMKHEKMTVIYKRYCKDDPKTMLGNFGKEWKSQSGRRDEIYAKYFDLYVGRLHRAAIESGCEGLPSLIHNEQEDAGGSAPNKCNECGGKCYVKKMAECPKCSGTGKIVHPPKQMITGMSAERVGVCPSCRGKGQVMQKVKCPACQN